MAGSQQSEGGRLPLSPGAVVIAADMRGALAAFSLHAEPCPTSLLLPTLLTPFPEKEAETQEDPQSPTGARQPQGLSKVAGEQRRLQALPLLPPEPPPPSSVVEIQVYSEKSSPA